MGKRNGRFKYKKPTGCGVSGDVCQVAPIREKKTKQEGEVFYNNNKKIAN